MVVFKPLQLNPELAPKVLLILVRDSRFTRLARAFAAFGERGILL